MDDGYGRVGITACRFFGECRGKFAFPDSDSRTEKIYEVRRVLRCETYGLVCTVKCVYKLVEFVLSVFPNNKYVVDTSHIGVGVETALFKRLFLGGTHEYAGICGGYRCVHGCAVYLYEIITTEFKVVKSINVRKTRWSRLECPRANRCRRSVLCWCRTTSHRENSVAVRI